MNRYSGCGPNSRGATGLYAWLDEALPRDAAPAETLGRMHVVLEEAVVNVVLHGFAPGAIGEITVRLRLTGEAACLIIEDNGKAFRPDGRTGTRPRSELIRSNPRRLGFGADPQVLPDRRL
ncbi:MAG: ATP-binding protein [Caulobacteraceae bacterium]